MADDLAGQYGDIFWDLQVGLQYVAGLEIHCTIYVANVTDITREYMLMAEASKGETKLAEYPITVDNAVWFTVAAESVVRLPGSLKIDYTDCILTMYLYERETNAVTDSVSVALTSSGPTLPAFPGYPAAPGSDWLSMLMMMMVVMMMMTMMTRMFKEEKEK